MNQFNAILESTRKITEADAETLEQAVFKYDELDDAAKVTAREWFREAASSEQWWSEHIIEDAKQIGPLLGFDVDSIYFSGFWSQGDGACFEGAYHYRADAVEALKGHAPQDKELAKIAAALASGCKDIDYAQIKHCGHYYHENSMDVRLGDRPDDADVSGQYDVLNECVSGFARWIYRRLEEEYEYVNSDEQVEEAIRANEYDFDAEGHRA